MSEKYPKVQSADQNDEKLNNISNNLGNLAEKLNKMNIEQLQEEIKLFQIENTEIKAKLSRSLIDQKRLHSALSSIRTTEQTLQDKISQMTSEMEEKKQLLTNLENEKSNESQKMNELKSKIHQIKDSIDFMNCKCKANSKLLSEIFSKEPSVLRILKEQIFEPIQILEADEITIETMIRMMSVYYEEFIKIILFLGNSDRMPVLNEKEKKSVEIEAKKSKKQVSTKNIEKSVQENLQKNDQNDEIQQSFHEIQMQNSKLNVSMMDKLKKSVNSNQNGGLTGSKLASFTQNIKDIGEQVQFIRDKLEATQKVQALETYENLKSKYTLLKQKKSEVDNKIQILEHSFVSLERENKEKIQLLLGNISNLRSLLNKEQEQRPIDINPADYDRFKFESKFKVEFEELKEKLNAKIQQKENIIQSKGEIDNFKKISLMDKVERVKLELNEAFKVEKDGFEKRILELNDKITELRKEKANILEAQRRKELLNFGTNEKTLHTVGMSMYEELKSEIAIKDNKINHILRENEEQMKRIMVFQNERNEIEIKNSTIEDLFFIFNQKATEIYLMAQKSFKVMVENKRLRRFIDETFHSLFKVTKTYGENLKDSGNQLHSILEGIQQLLFEAKSNPEFDPSCFRDYLLNPAKVKETPKVLINQSINHHDSIAFDEKNESMAVPYELFPEKEKIFNQNNDIDLLNRFNTTLMENLELKGQMETKDRRLGELTKDLFQYKKKISAVVDIEEKIESLVSQNARLKEALLELHSVALDKTYDGMIKISEISTTIETSTNVLDMYLAKNKKMYSSKMNFEKKAYILEGQIETINLRYNRLISELNDKLVKLEMTLSEKNSNIESLTSENKKVDFLEKEARRNELEFVRLMKENEVKDKTIHLLTQNLNTYTHTSDSDLDNLREMLSEMRAELTTQLHEKGELMTKKLTLEAEVSNLKSSKSDMSKKMNDLEEKMETMKNKNSSLIDQYTQLKNEETFAQMTCKKYKEDFESTENEKRSIENEYKLFRARMETLLAYNSENLEKERRKIGEEVRKQNEDFNQQRENEMFELRKQIGEMHFRFETKEQEINELKVQREVKNRQLVNFTKHLANVSGNESTERANTSALLNQNKDLLVEVEFLRSKVEKLENQYKGILGSIERNLKPLSKDEQLLQDKIKQTKEELFDQENQNEKNYQQIVNLIYLFEEKIGQKELEIKDLKNRSLLGQAILRTDRDEVIDLKSKIDDLTSENQILKEQNQKVFSEIEAKKVLNQEIKNLNKSLIVKNNMLGQSQIDGMNKDSHFEI